jgi:D-alanyl-D-alanine dipeptidase
MTESRLIEITPTTHGVDIDLVYATERNLTGKPIYKEAHCLLLEPAEAGLRKAVEIATWLSLAAVRTIAAARRST